MHFLRKLVFRITKPATLLLFCIFLVQVFQYAESPAIQKFLNRLLARSKIVILDSYLVYSLAYTDHLQVLALLDIVSRLYQVCSTNCSLPWLKNFVRILVFLIDLPKIQPVQSQNGSAQLIRPKMASIRNAFSCFLLIGQEPIQEFAIS